MEIPLKSRSTKLPLILKKLKTTRLRKQNPSINMNDYQKGSYLMTSY